MAEHPQHCDTEIRVRYAETDRMGFLHHAHYPVYRGSRFLPCRREAGLSVSETGTLR
jgi:acyl-CoA thioester hydrolase